MTSTVRASTSGLITALEQVRDTVAAAPLVLDLPGRDTASREGQALVDQVEDYLLPRLRDLDAPLLAVVGGSTGAGKSTLVNSLVGGMPVTASGVLRPTTRAPVLVCAPADRAAFEGDRVLPGMARTTGVGAPGSGLQLVVREELPPGLALLDAPDVDSVVEANRDLAGQLLSAADLWIFVTTAARYADAVPWDLLRTAQERGTALAVVLDRVPPEATREISVDLSRMLDEARLTGARLFAIEEQPLTGGQLPAEAVEQLHDFLTSLATDAQQRAEVVRQTLSGALASLDDRIRTVTEAAREQERAAGALSSAASAAHERARHEVDDGVRSGTLLRGEVLARWQDFVGTGEWMRGLQAGIGRLRDRVTTALRGRDTPADELGAALEDSVETLLRAAADGAAERTVTAWRSLPGGGAALGPSLAPLSRASAGFDERAARSVRDWQGFVLDLVREQGADKRTTARFLSYGVNGAGLAAMVALFASTGGLTGGEVAVAGGTSVAGQKVLEAVFGDSAVRALATRARADLDERTATLLALEQERFTSLLPHDDGVAGRLREAADGLDRARRA